MWGADQVEEFLANSFLEAHAMVAASDDAERRLLLYMIGWRKGVTAAAVTERNMADEDFKAGYEEGWAAKTTAYGAACLIYGTTLNPLRTEGEGVEFDREGELR